MTLLRADIASFIGAVGRLLIWRNSPLDEEGILAWDAGWAEKIEFCGTGENVGIPKALNYAWHRASAGGFTHLMTMDQDSQWGGGRELLPKSYQS